MNHYDEIYAEEKDSVGDSLLMKYITQHHPIKWIAANPQGDTLILYNDISRFKKWLLSKLLGLIWGKVK